MSATTPPSLLSPRSPPHRRRPSVAVTATAATPAPGAPGAPATSSQPQPERVCDTIPVPQDLILSRLVHATFDSSIRVPHPPSVSESFSRPQMATATHQNTSQFHPMDVDVVSTQPIPDPTQPPTAAARKLCVRHQRMADEGTTNKMQQVFSFPSFSYHLPSSRSRSSLPGAHLAISRASTPSHSPNAKPSTISGPLSPLPLIQVVSSSSAVSSPCAASPSFPSSPKSSTISSASILSLSYPPR